MTPATAAPVASIYEVRVRLAQGKGSPVHTTALFLPVKAISPRGAAHAAVAQANAHPLYRANGNRPIQAGDHLHVSGTVYEVDATGVKPLPPVPVKPKPMPSHRKPVQSQEVTSAAY